MYRKGKLTFMIVLALIFNLIVGCSEEEDPLTSETTMYSSSYGKITQVDDYPLYSIDYSSDYKFNQYLETGVLPFNNIESSNENEFQCTCVFTSNEGNKLFGRNYDWNEQSTYYLIFTNPDNAYSSVSTVDLSFFNYYHNQPPDHADNQSIIQALPYYPFDGMNEKGVVVGMNAVPEAQSSQDVNKITIGELQLIRLVLDYASTTEEAVALIRKYNVRMEQPPIHYLIGDVSGRAVVVEFVDGKMEIIENSSPWQLTTNFVLAKNKIDHNAPCWRYQTAYGALNESDGNLHESEVYTLMQQVSVNTTRWTTIYDLNKLELHIAMGRKFENPHEFSLE